MKRQVVEQGVEQVVKQVVKQAGKQVMKQVMKEVGTALGSILAVKSSKWVINFCFRDTEVTLNIIVCFRPLMLGTLQVGE